MLTNEERLRALLTRDDVWRAIAEMHSGRLAAALDAAGVFLPPEGAEMTEGTAVPIPIDGTYPWSEGEVQWDDERVVYWLRGYSHDITEAYAAWVEQQPKTNLRTYEWPEAS